jgi:hypothetical protein
VKPAVVEKPLRISQAIQDRWSQVATQDLIIISGWYPTQMAVPLERIEEFAWKF